jgi:hypothetical protein
MFQVVIFAFLTGFVAQASDSALIRLHLTEITKTEKFRNHLNTDQLDETAAYIFSVFDKYADTVYYQEYSANGRFYKNVIGSFGVMNARRIILGAHYDVCGDQEGADDNASGVVGLLELARLLNNTKIKYRIDLVAYTLEEPPYFRTEFMGSYIHAKSLADINADVYGMVSLEMIGYFSDEKGSQSYPLGILSFFYGNKGDYITLIRKFGSGKFARIFTRKYKSSATIKTKKFKGPASLPGIDFSDHLKLLEFWL